MGARLRCASETMATMRESIVPSPTLSARMISDPVPFRVPPISLLPTVLAFGSDSPVTMDSSTALLPSSTSPSTGMLSPGTDAQLVADLHKFERNVFVRGAVLYPPGRLWRQFEQGADRAARLGAGAQFENLAQQNKHGNDRGRLEIDRNRAHFPETRREEIRRERRDQAVDIRRPCSQRDQAEHVQAAVHDRCPAALEEGPAGPQDDGRRKDELNPARCPGRHQMMQPKRWNVAAHLQKKHGDRQYQADPEAPGHVLQLDVRAFLGGHDQRLQRHAANGTVSRPLVTYLGMHRAGVDRTGARQCLLRCFLHMHGSDLRSAALIV